MRAIPSILKKILYVLIPLALIAVVAMRLKKNKEIAEQRVYHYDKEEPIRVQVDTVGLEQIKPVRTIAGAFEPNRETRVSAELQGKINQVTVDAGHLVKKGQALVQLDNELLKLQLESIEVQIEGLEADVRRYTVLAESDAVQGVQLEKAELGLKAARVQKATVLEQIAKTTVRAPFDGVVTAKLTEEGAFAAPGVPLLQITDIALLKFTVNVPEKELASFSLNQTYALTADAYPELPLSGKATLISSKANMGSLFPVQFSVRNTPDLRIKSGMFGKVHLQEGIAEEGIVISTAAIVGNAEQPQVYVVRDGKAVLQSIGVSRKFQNKAVVSSGLQAGDVIVTGGLINLFEDAPVTVQ
jgi:RND family efflux transporter MFP subunit